MSFIEEYRGQGFDSLRVHQLLINLYLVMSSDTITTIVTGLQGNPVSSDTPTDGYSLIWDAASGAWKPKSNRLNQEVFTSDGTWTCPEGITTVLLIGYGGGGGGSNGSTITNLSSGGGGAAASTTLVVSVSPNVNYSVTIGSGGGPGQDGSSTTFDALVTFIGGGKAGFQGQNFSGGNAPGITSNNFLFTPGFGGNSNYAATASLNGNAGGVGGSDSGTSHGAGGGGGGPGGTGGNGGNGNNSGAGTNGSSAAANSGAGGGGGGCGSTAGGLAGSGGSGKLTIIW